MKRVLLVLAVLVLCLPMVGEGQSIQYKGAAGGGETVTAVANTNVSTATSGTSEEVLYTYTIPANTFPTAYSGLIVRYAYKHAANTNAASTRARIGGIGGTLVMNRTSSTSNDVILGEITCRVGGADSLWCWGPWHSASGTYSGAVPSEVGSLTFSGTIAFVLTGATGTSAGDIVLRQYSVSLIK